MTCERFCNWLTLITLFDDRRHLHREREDATLHLATTEPDFSIMRNAELLADDEPQTDSFVIHLVYVLELSELLEKALLVLLADADACVLHLHEDAFFLLDVGGVYLHEPVL